MFHFTLESAALKTLGGTRKTILSLVRVQIMNMCIVSLGSESRVSRGYERFLGKPPQTPPPGASSSPTSFKFVTECFFITQRALHVGLIPAVNTFTNITSELHKQQQAKVSGRDEDLLKLLNAVSCEENLSNHQLLTHLCAHCTVCTTLSNNTGWWLLWCPRSVLWVSLCMSVRGRDVHLPVYMWLYL